MLATDLDRLRRDQEAFETELPSLLAEHEGEFVIFNGGQSVDFLPTYRTALEAAVAAFGIDDVYFIAQVKKPSPPNAISLAWDYGVMFAES